MKQNSIIKSTLIVSSALIVIKILGVLKQSLIAAFYGANEQTDAYFVATGLIVGLCSVIFSSISISLLSMHSDRLISKGRESANNLINAVLRVFIPLAMLISIIFYFFAPLFGKLVAPTYSGSHLRLLSHYISAMSPMFIFTAYYLIINVVLETNKRFLPGKGQNFFQNIFICLATLLGYKSLGMKALIYAFLLAGVVQCIQITLNARNSFHFIRNVQPERESISKLLKLAIPLLIGNAIYEINDIVDKQVSTSIGHGNVSYLSYGGSINEIVTTLIISSISTVLFSHYATWVAQKDYEKIGNNFKNSLEALAAIIMPIMIMCFVCGTDIVNILYGRGNFRRTEIISTAQVVYGYSCGFLFQAFRANLVRVYYAFQDTKTPMINGAVSVTANVILSYTLSKFLGVGGIALATSISMFLVSALLLPGIKKFIPNFSLKSSIPKIIKPILDALIVFIVTFTIKHLLITNSYVTFIVIGLIDVLLYSFIGIMLDIPVIKKIYFIAYRKLRRN